MQYVRKIEQDKTDVRSKSYFVFKCNVCKEEQWINWRCNFNTKQAIKCPNCGVTDDSNDKEYLILRKHQIEQKLQACKTEVQNLSEELVEVSAKLDIIERNHKKCDINVLERIAN